MVLFMVTNMLKRRRNENMKKIKFEPFELDMLELDLIELQKSGIQKKEAGK